MQATLALAGGVDSRPLLGQKETRFPGIAESYGLDDDEIVVDSFAGAGGMSCGIEMAIGRSPDIAINHDPVAIRTHEANHPDTKHYSASVYALDPRDLVPKGKRVGIFWASPDCFIAGTLVMTIDGLKPIEEITEGQLVLTHKGRWRRVVKAWSQTSQTVEVQGQGHDGLITTPNHGFYSKRITTRWPGIDKETGRRPGAKRTLFENPYWPKAKDMKGKYWATPHAFPAGSIPICDGAEFSDDFFYFFGRWLGDGSINKGDVEICTGKHEAEEAARRFTASPLRRREGEIVSFRTLDRQTTIAFIWGNAPLTRWLEENAGRLAHDKRLPVWCLSMQRSWREALLKGYLDADGHEDGRRTSASSVSKPLALGLRLLATSLGHSVSMHMTKGGPCTIEGRDVIAKERHHISWTTEPKNQTTFTDTLHKFTLVREVVDAGIRQVFCLEVEEDESFVADGIVVHNCRSHSRARGKAPKSKSVRDLAWVVVHWAELVAPRIIGIENVPEFVKWCELGPNGQPIPGTEGQTFRQWVSRLEALGYQVEWKILNAADYGAPTTRNRLFLQARRDHLPILWPEASHGRSDHPLVKMGLRQPWRTAAECIDYSIPTHSIFLDGEDAKKAGCKRPLAEKTLRRIAKGMFRHVINNPSPFILNYYGERREGDGFRGNALDRPFATATTENRFGLVVPLTHQGDDRVYSANDTFRTITGANRGELAWVAPTMIQTGYGERKGQQPRCLDMHNPLGTVVAGGAKHAMVAAHLTCMNQNAAGSLPSDPLKTVMAGAVRHVYIESELEGPLDRSLQVAEFLWKYRHLSERPVTRDALGIVHVDGIPMRITDIGLRMLVGRELAKAQGFDPRRFDPTKRREDRPDGTPAYAPNTATSIVRMIGNSVSPPVGCAVIGAMLGRGVRDEAKAA